MRRAAIALAALCATGAHATEPRALTAAALSTVGVTTRPDAIALFDTSWRTATGRSATLREVAAGRPLVLVFADYGCTALCGPALAIVAARLRESGLAPGHDFNLAVIGLDPKSSRAEAQAFGDARLGAATPLGRHAAYLTGDAPAIADETAALGFGYVADPAANQFVHPVAAFVLTPTGRVAAVLSEVTLTPAALGAMVAAARSEHPTGAIDRLAIACHRALAVVGRFDAPALAAMRIGAVATLVALALAVAWWVRRSPGRFA